MFEFIIVCAAERICAALLVTGTHESCAFWQSLRCIFQFVGLTSFLSYINNWWVKSFFLFLFFDWFLLFSCMPLRKLLALHSLKFVWDLMMKAITTFCNWFVWVVQINEKQTKTICVKWLIYHWPKYAIFWIKPKDKCQYVLSCTC